MVVQHREDENNQEWLNINKILLDSGCSHHMAREESFVSDLEKYLPWDDSDMYVWEMELKQK